MNTFREDETLTKLAQTRDEDELFDASDGSCTTGFDNDGSTGLEMVEAGIDLGRLAGKRPIWKIDFNEVSAVFFVGTLKQVKERLKKLPEKTEEDTDEE